MYNAPAELVETIKEKARAEYRSVVGKLVRIHCVDAWDSKRHENVTVELNPPAVGRILETDDEYVTRWGDEVWLDPWWNVEILEKRPELEGLEGFYVYGTSWSIHGEKSPSDDCELIEKDT